MTHDHHLLVNVADPFGIAVVIVGIILTASAFVVAIRALLWPGETEPDHPKRIILREDR